MMILVVLRWLVFGDDHIVVVVDKSQYEILCNRNFNLAFSVQSRF